MSAVLTIAHLTLFEARRRRILAVALLSGAAFLAVFGIGMFFVKAELLRDGESFVSQQADLSLLTLTGLYATNLLSVLLAVLLPVDTLSGEIDSGVIHTLASKPIRRADIVLGKWLGHGVIVAVYTTGLSIAVLLAGRLAAGHVQLGLGRALPLMLLEVALLLSVSMAGGTRLGTVANGVFTLAFFGLAFIGGWLEQIGTLTGLESARNIGIAVSLVSPADAVWRLAFYRMLPDIVRNLVDVPPIFVNASVPSGLMVWWAAGFLVLTLLVAVRSFDRRAL